MLFRSFLLDKLYNQQFMIMNFITFIQFKLSDMQEEVPEEQYSKQTFISILVSQPETRKEYGGAKPYYVYTLTGTDAKGSIDIKRRYSEFQSLRNALVKRWPGVFIPSLPAKLKIMYSEEEFIQIRSKYLQRFLQYLTLRQQIWYEEEVQFFVKNSQLSCDKVLGSFAKVDIQEVIYRYEQKFKAFDGQKSQEYENAKSQVGNFEKQLKVIFVKIQNLRNKAEVALNAQIKYQMKYTKNLFPILTKYQRKCLPQYIHLEDKQVGILSKEETVQKKEDLIRALQEASFTELFQEIKRQKRQIFAFQQAFEEREHYVKQGDKIREKIKGHEISIGQLMGGKKTFMQKVKKLSTDDSTKFHEESISKYKNQLQGVDKVRKYIDLIMCQEIKKFKQERVSSYYSMVKEVMKLELRNLQKQQIFWKQFEQYDQMEHYFDIDEQKEYKDFSSPLKKEHKIAVLEDGCFEESNLPFVKEHEEIQEIPVRKVQEKVKEKKAEVEKFEQKVEERVLEKVEESVDVHDEEKVEEKIEDRKVQKESIQEEENTSPVIDQNSPKQQKSKDELEVKMQKQIEELQQKDDKLDKQVQPQQIQKIDKDKQRDQTEQEGYKKQSQIPSKEEEQVLNKEQQKDIVEESVQQEDKKEVQEVRKGSDDSN